MKQPYKLLNGQVTQIEVSANVAKLFLDFAREDKNAARNERRRNEISLDDMYAKTGFEPADTNIDIERDFITREEKNLLLMAIALLSDKQRRLVHLRYYEEKTEYEIAEILNINQSNVHRQLKTIHSTLKKYLEKLL